MIVVQHWTERVEVSVFGEFTLADYKEFEETLSYKLKFERPVDLLFDLREMVSFTLDVAWEDIVFSRSHADDFNRIAVLTDSQWVAWSAWLSQIFVNAELRVFKEEDEARAWLDEESGRPAYLTLVSGAVLADHLQDPDWRVFDCRHRLADTAYGERAYAKAHLPGAFFMHLDRDLSGPMNGRNGRHPLPDPYVLAARLGTVGVTNETQVVVYDDVGGMIAARLWWMLRWLGHDRVALLDGGFQGWVNEERALTHELPRAVPAHFRAKPRDWMVGAAEVLDSLHTSRLCLIDARSPERFRGENETLDRVGGRIPGARNRYCQDNLDADNHFRPAAKLRSEFLALLAGTDPTRSVMYCGSGVTACHNLLAMKIAGLHGARLYAGSWSEWCADPKRPVTR